MSRFSERIRGSDETKVLQVEDMNMDLRISLWNVGYSLIFRFNTEFFIPNCNSSYHDFIYEYLRYFAKKPVDESRHISREHFKNIFLSDQWDKVYDFLEFVSQWSGENTKFQNVFHLEVNDVLQRESSGYRIIGGLVTPVVDAWEVEEIAMTLSTSDGYGSVRFHLKSALQLMSDRNNPDYRNSIKESISAVESLVKNITEDEKGTLGKLIKILGREKELPPTIIKAYDALYGYTSHEDGIRHAMLDMDESKLKHTDARYMLIVCSAFINYVIESEAVRS